MTKPSTLSVVLGVLLVISAALFAVGVAVERSQPHREVVGHATQPEGSTTGSEAASPGESGVESPAAHAAEGSGAVTREAGEKILGINPESTALVVAALVGSLLLAFAALRVERNAPILVVIAAAALVFAAFDLREVFFQVDRSRPGVATIAALVAALHVAAAGAAIVLRRRTRRALAG